ncbi:metal-dependent hydrolase [Marinitoga arctica]
MPNFKTHIISGVLFYPIYFLLYSFIMDILNTEFYPSESIILISFFFFLLGADLPDIDHNFSFINKLFRILLVGLGIFMVFKIRRYFDFLSFLHLKLYIIKTLYIIFGIIIGGIIGILFNNMTKHRGKWHSLFTGILFGIIVYFLKVNNYYTFSFEALFLGLSLTIGFCVHLFLDYFFKS